MSYNQDFNHANPRCHPDMDGFPNLKLNVFEIISFFDAFNRRSDDPSSKDSVGIGKDSRKLLAWEVCEVFFGGAAAALRGLECD